MWRNNQTIHTRFPAVWALVFLLALAGCGVNVVPRPTSATLLNPNDNSLTQKVGKITISARVQDLSVAPYQMVDNISSFYVTVRNESGKAVLVPLESFLLVDSEGEQYRPIRPSEIQGIVSRDSEYLIPYPYVGFYYLEDAAKYGFFNSSNSALPYYAENHPQDLYTRALPVDSILPGNLITGEIYFVVELTQKKGFELRVYLPDTPVTGPADYTFPFSVEK